MTAQAVVWRAARETALFAAFAGIYAWPIWSLLLGSSVSDERLSRALASALESPSVLQGVALNLVTHIGLLALCYAGLAWLAGQLARAAQVSHPLAMLLVLTCAWVWLVSGNAVLFARSNYSVPFAVIANPLSWTLSSAALLAMLALVLWRRGWPRPRAGWMLSGAVIGIAVLWIARGPGPDAWAKHAPARNVIIVGIDSLSAPLMEHEQARLPHLTQLLAQATRHERAYTPLGRTYPAWVSILSGQAPATHGALFNLRGVEHADRQNLLTRELQAQGYRTVYAIDERRFNNIDESFGFDQVVGPQAGALDFALQGINDTPLTNLLLQTRAADRLLPYSRLNVASIANYDARGFVDEIGRASAGPQPLFLAVHFLSGHFPFATRHATLADPDPNAIRARHVEALTAADTQVGWLMNELAARGRLDDALVIVLSDHGEAVGDAEPFQRADGEFVAAASYGHGANLLSEHQNRIVLATLHYRQGRPVAADAPASEQVSLLDVRASVQAFVRSGAVELKAGSDCIPVETELRLAATDDYRHLDMRQVAAQGIGLYELDDQGRLKLRESLLAGLTASKDIGLRCLDRLTVFTPRDGRYRAYRLSAGAPPQETGPRAEDMARIDAYRSTLMEQATGANDPTRRKLAG
jgi:hypothetical protein